MSTELALLITSAAIFFGYVSLTFIKFGVDKSISKTWYLLKPKNKWLFRAATWGYAIPLGIAGGTIGTYTAGALISLVGFTPDTKGKNNKLERKIHVFGATAGIVVAVMSAWLEFGLWYIPAIQAAFTIPAMKAPLRNHTWYIEVLAYVLSAGYILSSII